MSTVGPSLGTSSEEREELTVEDVLKRLQNGLFGVLFITNKNSDHNLTWHILETLIDHMQDLGFPLCFAFAPWQKEISWFRLLTKWFSPEKMIKATPVVFNILLSALGVVLLNALFVGFSFSQNRFRFIWTLKLLRVTLGLISTILFIPFLAFFTLAIVNCEHHDIQSCWTSPYLLKTIGTVAVMTLFILLALCVKATFFEPDPKIKDVSSRPHSRLDLLYLTCRTTLTLATIALEVFGEDEHDGEKNKSIAIWVTAVLCVVASMALAIGFIWYIPYYNFKYAMFRAGLMAHFAWASLCFFYTVLRPESDIGILYLIEAPLAFVVACLLVSARRRQVEGLDPSLITDPFVLELHIRFKLLNAGLLYKETGSGSPVEKKLGGGSAVSGGAVSGGAVSGISIGGYRPVNGEKEWSSMDEIVEIFVMASKTMPSSCILHLFAGAFHLNHLGNRAQCLATYTKAESMHPRLDEAFMIYRRQRLLNERFSGGDVIDFIAFEQNMQLAKKYESKATMAVINFWAELLKRHPSFWRLQRHGTTISQAASTSQGHYLALIKLSPNTAHVYRLYGNFLINVLNDQKQGQDLLDHADELEEENREENVNQDLEDGEEPEDHSIDLVSEDNAMVTISGEISNLGHVININAMALKAFGYRRHEVLHQNISKLLPSPFSESHDMFLQKYLETGYAKVVDRSRQVLGLNKAGYLFPLILCVKHVVDAKGMQSFFGIIKSQTESESLGYMIMNESYEILHFTKNLSMLFNAKPYGGGSEGQPQLYKISDWIPSATAENASLFLSKSGFRVQHTSVSNGQLIDILLHADRSEVTGTPSFICRLKIKSDKATEKDVSQFEVENSALPSACPFKNRTEHSNSREFTSQPQALAFSNLASDAESSNDSVVALPMTFSAKANEANITSPYLTSHLSQGPTSGRLPASDFPAPSQLNATIKKTTIVTESDDMMAVSKENSNEYESKYLPPTKQSPAVLKGYCSSIESLHKKKSEADRESLGSRGSRATSAKSSVKRVLSLKSEKSNRQLQMFHFSFIVCFLVLSAIAVFDFIEHQKYLVDAKISLDNIIAKNDFALNLIEMADVSRSIDLRRVSGWFWENATCTPSTVTARANLNAVSEALRSSAGAFETCKAPMVQYVNSDNNGMNYLSLPIEAMSTTIASARFLTDSRMSDPNLKSQIALILFNAPFEVLRAVNACSEADLATTLLIGTQKPMQVLLLSIMGPVVCFAFLFLIVQPLYMRIEDGKEKFLRMFYDIPKEVIKGIYESHYQRLANAEDEEADEDGDLINRMAMEKVLSSFENLPNGDSSNSKPRKNSKGFMYFKDGSQKDSILTRWIRKSVYDHHHVLHKSMAVFITSILYFLTIGSLSYVYLSRIDDVGSNLFWSSQRPILVRQESFFVREAFTDLIRNMSLRRGIPSSMLSVALNMSQVSESLTSVSTFVPFVERSILYGSSDLHLEAVMSKGYNDPHARLELQNACVTESPSDCDVFESSVMKRGLHAASAWYQKLSQDSLAAIYNTTASLSSMETLLSIDSLVTRLRLLDTSYLTPAYAEATRNYERGFDGLIDWFLNLNLSCSISYVLLLLAFYLFVIRPLLKAIAEDMKRTAALIYMLPSQVFTEVPTFRRWIEKQMNGESTSSARNLKMDAKSIP